MGSAEDWYLASSASAALRIVGDLQLRLAAENQRLVPSKSAAFFPAVDAGLEPLGRHGNQLAALVSRSFGGLEVLGSALQGRCVTCIRHGSDVPEDGPAAARAEDVEVCARRCWAWRGAARARAPARPRCALCQRGLSREGWVMTCVRALRGGRSQFFGALRRQRTGSWRPLLRCLSA